MIGDTHTHTTNIDTDNVEVTPGTVHLVDADGTMSAKHRAGSDQDIVLVPRPSSHPDDPLNWSRRRKMLAAFCMALYVIISHFHALSLVTFVLTLMYFHRYCFLNLRLGEVTS